MVLYRPFKIRFSNTTMGKRCISFRSVRLFARCLYYTLIFFFLIHNLTACVSAEKKWQKGSILMGTVVGITDGDTFTLLTENRKQQKIRLYGIDCPEKKQPFGTVAKNQLSELIFGKKVKVEVRDYDRWGRMVGMVLRDESNVNEEMLKSGYAWQYSKYDKSLRWSELEKTARAAGMGLWVEANPTPPWEWRKPEVK